MPRVISVAHARKPTKCDKCGDAIKKGDPYRHATLKTGPYSSHRKVRCAKPACGFKPSDLTSSAFKSTLYGLEEQLGSIEPPANMDDAIGDLESIRDDLVGQINELADECQEKFDNMPEGLQQGDTGQMLENRVSECQSWASELEGVDIALDEEEKPTKDADESADEYESRVEEWEEARSDKIQEIIQALQDCTYNGE